MLRRIIASYGFVIAFSGLVLVAITAGGKAGNIHVIFLAPIIALFLLQFLFRSKRLVSILLAIPIGLLILLYVAAIGGEMTAQGQELLFACVVLPLTCAIPLLYLWTLGAFRILRRAHRDTYTHPA